MTRRTSYAAALVAGIFTASFPYVSCAGEVLAKGSFRGANGHSTSGGVSVEESEGGVAVVLGSDFNLDGAPDPKVGFGKNGRYDPESKLSHLQSNSGKQVYEVPDSIDAGGYNEVYIWCDKFSVSLGVATLE